VARKVKRKWLLMYFPLVTTSFSWDGELIE
jgi:large subunit ribosomal protein L13e